MTALAFDTLAYAKEMEAAGFSREQAEAFAAAQGKILKEAFAATELATKTDVNGVRVELKAEIQDVRTEMLRLENKMEANKHEILKWVIGTMVAQTALIVAVIAFLK